MQLAALPVDESSTMSASIRCINGTSVQLPCSPVSKAHTAVPTRTTLIERDIHCRGGEDATEQGAGADRYRVGERGQFSW